MVLAVIRPKSIHNGTEYKPKYYDILLLDHRNPDKHGKTTKFLPSFKLTGNFYLRSVIRTVRVGGSFQISLPDSAE